MVRMSQQQKEQLVEFMEMNPWFVNGTFCRSLSVKDRKKTWETLAKDLNSLSTERKKTLKGWKMSWTEQKKTVREKLAKINETLRTPEGIYVKSHPLTPIEKRIAAIVGWSTLNKRQNDKKKLNKSGTTVPKRKPVRSSIDFQRSPQQELTSEASPRTSLFSQEDTVPKYELPVSFTESPELDFLPETRPQQELTSIDCSESSNRSQENTDLEHNSASDLGSFTETPRRGYLHETVSEYITAIKEDIPEPEPEVVIIEDNPEDFQEEHSPETISESISTKITSVFSLANGEIRTSNQELNEKTRPSEQIQQQNSMQSSSPSASVQNDSSYEGQSESFPNRMWIGPPVAGVQQDNSSLDALVAAQRETVIVLNRLANATEARNSIEQERNEIFGMLLSLLGSKVSSL